MGRWLPVGLALAGSAVAGLTLPGCCDGEEQFYEGRVYLLRGSTVSRGGELGAADADGVWVSADRAALAGFSLGSAGDQDGDGVPDLLVGAPGWRAEPPALDPCH